MKKLFSLILLVPSLAAGSGIYNPGSGNGGGGGGASTLQVFVGPARSSPTASITGYTGDFIGSVIGGTTFQFALNPNTTDFIHNQTTSQSATFFTSSGTATNFNTTAIQFQARNSVLNSVAGTTLLSMPDTNTMYFGEGTPTTGGGGTFNVCTGPSSCAGMNGGSFSTAYGNASLDGAFTGQQSNCIGYAACSAMTGGSFNNAMGGSALLNTTTANNIVGVGLSACRDCNADSNTAVGTQASIYLKSGTGNTEIGYFAGAGTTTFTNSNVAGNYNTRVGYQSGQSVSSSTVISNSIALGYQAWNDASNQAQIGGTNGSGNEVLLRVSSASIQSPRLDIAGVTYRWPTAQASGTKILSNDGSGNLSWATDATGGGGGGASTLAVTTGTTAGYVGAPASSPTAIVNFDQSQFAATLQGGATAFVTVAPSISNVSGNFTIGSTSTVVLANCSASCTVTLPTAAGITGRVLSVKIIGTGATTVATTSAQTIDGSTTVTPLPNQYASLDIISDGTNWEIK